MLDRIKEFRRVKAKELTPNPKNWRKHSARQKEVMEQLLEQIGYADALIARETDAGLMLIDGHLRASLDDEQEVPVLVVDLDEDEADLLLTTLDPLAAMAVPIPDALEDLIGSLSGFFDAGVMSTIEEVQAPNLPLQDLNEEWVDMPEFNAPGDKPFKKLSISFGLESHFESFKELMKDNNFDVPNRNYWWYIPHEDRDKENVRITPNGIMVWENIISEVDDE